MMETGSKHIREEKLPIGKFLFFGIMAMALSSFPPLAIFAPVPLTLVFLLMGRPWGAFLGIFGFAFLTGATLRFGFSSAASTLFFIAFINALLISETIFRKISPAKSLNTIGLVFLGLMILAVGIYAFAVHAQLKNDLVNTIAHIIEKFRNDSSVATSKTEEAKLIQEMFGNPSEMARQIIQWIPRMTFLSIVFGFWMSFFVILRNAFIWRPKIEYPFVLDDLLKFKVPDYLVYAVIVGLALLLGETYFGARAVVWGETIIYSLGALYFFQGFGVFLAFLTWMGVWGIFRTMIIAFTLLLAWRVLPIIGLFDLWVDFRKLFERKKEKEKDSDKGDWL